MTTDGALTVIVSAMLAAALTTGSEAAAGPIVAPAVAGPVVPVTAVTASSHDGNVPANAVDGNFSTRWSGEGDGVWIRFDLGSSRSVGSVSLAWHQGDTRRSTFDVQTSVDGSSWTTVLSRRVSSGTTTGLENHEFADRAGRYVRIVGHENTVNDWTSILEATVHGPDGGGGGGDCEHPADVLNLTNWYIGLPVGEDESPTNVEQPELDSFSISPWFVPTADCARVQFRAAVNGVTTSGSNYPRSELREMRGSSKASWSSTSGTHTMTVRQAITHLPADKPHVVAGQIHDSGDDVSVFRLEGRNLYLTNGDNSHYKLITSSYTLGTEFEAKFVVSGGSIKAYYNGALQATIQTSFSGGYFKAGAYTQANCSNSSPCGTSNYGQVLIRSLTVTHS